MPRLIKCDNDGCGHQEEMFSTYSSGPFAKITLTADWQHGIIILMEKYFCPRCAVEMGLHDGVKYQSTAGPEFYALAGKLFEQITEEARAAAREAMEE